MCSGCSGNVEGDQARSQNINGYPETCVICDKKRTCNADGVCHECRQAELDAELCVECGKSQDACSCEGGPWIPGGYRL